MSETKTRTKKPRKVTVTMRVDGLKRVVSFNLESVMNQPDLERKLGDFLLRLN